MKHTTYMLNEKIRTLKSEVEAELTHNILPFWSTRMTDPVTRGFYGQMDSAGNIGTESDKGCILNTRILWTFSAAYRLLKKEEYLHMAERAKDYFLTHFIDREFGGVFWNLDHKGDVKDSKKQIYAQGFAIYALSEYYRCSNDETCLRTAIEIFNKVERFSYDRELGGYFEAFDREWEDIEDLRLSEKDANEKKTMNTHLHVLEGYTNLYRVWKNPTLKKQLHKLILDFLQRIVNKQTFHLDLFFDEQWQCKSDIVSYGHDIECSWLLDEAAHVLGDTELIRKVQSTCLKIAGASGEGIMSDGSMIYEKDNTTGHTDTDRHWWVQAENVIGLVNAFQISGNPIFFDKALDTWHFITNHIIDKTHGEWYWSVNKDMQPNLDNDKAGFWKCPYHNSRMCIEIIERDIR
jgi:cellobiose epimerase